MIQVITIVLDNKDPMESYLRAKGSFPDSSLLDLKAAKDKYEEIVLLLNILKDRTGWTDEKIADKLGYARSTIQKWKCGYLRPGTFHQDEIIEQIKELIRREV
jgi:hypothetical protein